MKFVILIGADILMAFLLSAQPAESRNGKCEIFLQLAEEEWDKADRTYWRSTADRGVREGLGHIIKYNRCMERNSK